MAFCNECKNQVPDGTKFCPYCGAPIVQQPQQRPAPQFYPQEEPQPAPKRPATVVVSEEPVRPQMQQPQPEPEPQPQPQAAPQPEPQPEPMYQQAPKPQPQFEPEAVKEIEVTDTGYSSEKQLRTYGLILFILLCVIAGVLIIVGIAQATSWYGNGMIFLLMLLYACLIVFFGWGGWTMMKVLSNISTNLHEMNMRMRG